MTVACRAPSAPRVVGSDYARYGGSGAHLYGEEGDVCQYPGCHVLLSAYNERDVCCCHAVVGKKRKLRKRGEARSAGHEVATTAAEPPRRVTREELEMAAAERQKVSDAKASVLAALTDEYVAAPRIAEKAGIKEANAYYHLKRLVEEGRVENKLGKGGGYRLRQDVVAEAAEAARERETVKDEAADCQEDEAVDDATAATDHGRAATPESAVEDSGTASSEAPKSATAPADPTGAAPDTSPERLAPAAPGPPEESPAAGTMPPPFAGGVDPRCFETPAWSAPFGQFLEAQPVRYMHSDEVECMARLERLADDARERVLTWGNSRWPVAREVVVHVDCAPSAEAMAEAVLGLVKGAGQ